MPTIAKQLQWTGPWVLNPGKLPKSIPDEAGLFMMLLGLRAESGKIRSGSYVPLFLGDANAIRSSLEKHRTWHSWAQDPNGVILLKVALFSGDQAMRKMLLRICGDSIKPRFYKSQDSLTPAPDTTFIVMNSGKHPPLAPRIAVRPHTVLGAPPDA